MILAPPVDHVAESKQFPDDSPQRFRRDPIGLVASRLLGASRVLSLTEPQGLADGPKIQRVSLSPPFAGGVPEDRFVERPRGGKVLRVGNDADDFARLDERTELNFRSSHLCLACSSQCSASLPVVITGWKGRSRSRLQQISRKFPAGSRR